MQTCMMHTSIPTYLPTYLPYTYMHACMHAHILYLISGLVIFILLQQDIIFVSFYHFIVPPNIRLSTGPNRTAPERDNGSRVCEGYLKPEVVETIPDQYLTMHLFKV